MLHLCFFRQGIRLIKRMCPIANNIHIQGVFKFTQAAMTPLASHWDACLKEGNAIVLPPLLPGRWQNITLIPLEVRSAARTRGGNGLLYPESIWDYCWFSEIYFYLWRVCHGTLTRNRTDRWGHNTMAPYAGKQVTPAEVVWCPAGCPEGVELRRMSQQQLSPPANVNDFPMR